MDNKTCGECKFHHRDYHYCQADKECKSIYPESPACENFAERTIAIGDKIRSMSNESLAEVFMDLYDGNKCKYCAYKKSGMCSLKPRHEDYDEGGWAEDEDCIRGMIEYLKKEVKDE